MDILGYICTFYLLLIIIDKKKQVEFFPHVLTEVVAVINITSKPLVTECLTWPPLMHTNKMGYYNILGVATMSFNAMIIHFVAMLQGEIKASM